MSVWQGYNIPRLEYHAWSCFQSSSNERPIAVSMVDKGHIFYLNGFFQSFFFLTTNPNLNSPGQMNAIRRPIFTHAGQKILSFPMTRSTQCQISGNFSVKVVGNTECQKHKSSRNAFWGQFQWNIYLEWRGVNRMNSWAAIAASVKHECYGSGIYAVHPLTLAIYSHLRIRDTEESEMPHHGFFVFKIND